MKSMQNAIPMGYVMGNLATHTVLTGTSWEQHLVIKKVTVEENDAPLDSALLKKLDSLREEQESTYSSFEEALIHLNNLKRS